MCITNKYVFFPQKWPQIHEQYYNFCGDHDTNMESHQLVPQSVSEEVNPHNSLVVMDNWSFQSDSMKLCSQEQVQLRNCGLPVLTDVTLPTEHHVEKHSRLVLMVRAVCLFCDRNCCTVQQKNFVVG